MQLQGWHSQDSKNTDGARRMPLTNADSQAEKPGFSLGSGLFLEPSDGHLVWWTEGGDPQGLPVLMVHGGPGGRSRPEVLAWWRGLPVRWLAMDQRGCGQSLPEAHTDHNSLDALVRDMERLRIRLGLERWALAGGSWGTLVTLAYWLRHPSRVAGMHLRSSFLGSRAEIDRYIAPWFDWLGGPGRAALGQDAEQLPRLFHGATSAFDGEAGLTRSASMPWQDERLLADAWNRYDDAQSQPGGVVASRARWSMPHEPPVLPGGWRVFEHFARHAWFLGEPLRDALREADAPDAGTPVALVHGARDACCDVQVSRWLAAWCPHAELVEVGDGGHRMNQPEMAQALRDSAVRWVARVAARRDRHADPVHPGFTP